MKKAGLIILISPLFLLYVVKFYNSMQGHSYLYKPVLVKIEAEIPEGSDIQVTYTTVNNPIAHVQARRIIPDKGRGIFAFEIDSGYRLLELKLYFSGLEYDGKIRLSSLDLSSGGNMVIIPPEASSFSVSGNLDTRTDATGALLLRRINSESEPGPSLTLKLSGDFEKDILIRTGLRKIVFPSAGAGILLVLLGIPLTLILISLFNLRPDFQFSIEIVLLCLIALLLPLGEKMVNLLFALLILYVLGKNIYNRNLKILIKERLLPVLLTAVFILVYTLSLLRGFDNNTLSGIYKIKMALPLVILAAGLSLPEKKLSGIILIAFLSGTLLSLFSHLGSAILFSDNNETGSLHITRILYLFESYIYSRVHHSYVSLTYMMSILIILFSGTARKISKPTKIILIVLLSTGVILAYSRAGLLAWGIIMVMVSLKYATPGIYNTFINVMVYILPLLMTVTLFLFIFTGISGSIVQGRREAGNQRILIWDNSRNIIKKHPLSGAGMALYNMELNILNDNKFSSDNNRIFYNSHNQFLESSGMFGIITGIMLIWFIFAPAIISSVKTGLGEISFHIAIITVSYFMFESFLNRNMGVILFSSTYTLLFAYSRLLTESLTWKKLIEKIRPKS